MTDHTIADKFITRYDKIRRKRTKREEEAEKWIKACERSAAAKLLQHTTQGAGAHAYPVDVLQILFADGSGLSIIRLDEEGEKEMYVHPSIHLDSERDAVFSKDALKRAEREGWTINRSLIRRHARSAKHGQTNKPASAFSSFELR